MLNSLLNLVFGCSHTRTSFPLTPARKAGFNANNARHGTYVVCLDCGKEFNYNWTAMRIGDPVTVPVRATGAFSPVER
jgi:hypothetical protein